MSFWITKWASFSPNNTTTSENFLVICSRTYICHIYAGKKRVKTITIIEANIEMSHNRKNIPAIFSVFMLLTSLLVRRDRNESIALIIKKTTATAVNSSIKEASLESWTWIAVITIKHNPRRFDAVLSMWGALFLLIYLESYESFQVNDFEIIEFIYKCIVVTDHNNGTFVVVERFCYDW